MTAAAIAAQALEKRFGRSVALRGVDFEVPPGRSLAVLGPNGAGKSTLLRLIAGLSRPSGGRLTIAGEASHARRTRARIGYIGHATLLYPNLSARENLVFAARCHGLHQPGERADHLLAEAGLQDVAHRPAGAFSRGMAQRLAIARGLVHDPEVVLLDEPFTGLDSASARRFTARIEDLRRAGRTLVLVTHDLRFAAEFGDLVLVLAGGRIAYRGTAPLDFGALERAVLGEGGAAT